MGQTQGWPSNFRQRRGSYQQKRVPRERKATRAAPKISQAWGLPSRGTASTRRARERKVRQTQGWPSNFRQRQGSYQQKRVPREMKATRAAPEISQAWRLPSRGTASTRRARERKVRTKRTRRTRESRIAWCRSKWRKDQTNGVFLELAKKTYKRTGDQNLTRRCRSKGRKQTKGSVAKNQSQMWMCRKTRSQKQGQSGVASSRGRTRTWHTKGETRKSKSRRRSQRGLPRKVVPCRCQWSQRAPRW